VVVEVLGLPLPHARLVGARVVQSDDDEELGHLRGGVAE
jgi:hypothetical protein